jgi:hypothetical protein
MLRWLTLVLLFVLPLQFAWSAAAAYCQHEEAPATAHVGHHSHVHQGGKSGDDGVSHEASKASKAGKLAADNDCGYCHLSFAKPMIAVSPQFDAGAASALHEGPTRTFRSRGPDQHDRPNWRIA